MSIDKFSRDFWKTAVAYGGSNEIVVRDHDIISAHKEGKCNSQIADKFGLSVRQVRRIINQKYK